MVGSQVQTLEQAAIVLVVTDAANALCTALPRTHRGRCARHFLLAALLTLVGAALLVELSDWHGYRSVRALGAAARVSSAVLRTDSLAGYAPRRRAPGPI
jgi:hypothetical protein